MSSPKSKQSYNLLCVAHPDDEAIFFGGLLQRRQKRPWIVICMTDGNADGHGRKRKRQFEESCRALGVQKFEWWAYKDMYQRRLPVDEIAIRLCKLARPTSVFTHGPIGEYGHPHHQDVSVAVHRAFPDHPRVFAASYNAMPDLQIHLTKAEFETKARVLTEIYGSETMRFLNLLPATTTEGFLRLSSTEVEALYSYFSSRARLNKNHLSKYAWLEPFLKIRRAQKRPF